MAKLTFHPDLTADEQKWEFIRQVRNARIGENRKLVERQLSWQLLEDPRYDWNVLRSLLLYEQQLRDIPQSFENPDDVVFPDPEISPN